VTWRFENGLGFLMQNWFLCFMSEILEMITERQKICFLLFSDLGNPLIYQSFFMEL
jgi:hypothetical protein